MHGKTKIKFRFQLNAQYFISIVMFLYMFRAHLCPSSGGPLYIYNIWFYVSLQLPLSKTLPAKPSAAPPVRDTLK